MAYKTGEMVSLMVHIGDELGLYEAMAGMDRVDAESLAEATGLHVRWVREWLRGQGAAGIVDHLGQELDEDSSSSRPIDSSGAGDELPPNYRPPTKGRQPATRARSKAGSKR